MSIKNTIFFIAAAIPTAAKSQHKTEHTNMLWEGYYNSFSISKNWFLLSDVQLRTRDWAQHWSQMSVRSGLSYQANKHVSITAGFAFLKNAEYINKALFKNEYRPWQEFYYQLKFKKIAFTQRLRTEQRFQQKILDDQLSKKYPYIFRLRYRCEALLPLKSNKIAFLAANEIMINPGKLNHSLFFDQNRSFAGINFKVQNSTTLQFQYIKIFQWRSTTSILENQDVLRVNLFQQLSSRKQINKHKKRTV